MFLNSMRARMTANFAGSIALLMALVCGSLIWYSHVTAHRTVDTLLHATAARVQWELTNSAERVDFNELLTEERVQLETDKLGMLVVDASGRIIHKAPHTTFTWPRKAEDGWQIQTVPFGSSTVVLGFPWYRTERTLRTLALVLLGISLFVVVSVSIGAWLLVGRTLSPIGRLSQQAQVATPEDRHLHLTAPSQDAEVVELVSTLNHLISRVTETTAAKGRFYAAASHELRTPLQALSGHLELALSKSRSADAYRTSLEEAHLQTRRLTALIRDLLLLHQLDSPLAPPPACDLNLTEVCEHSLAPLCSLLSQRHLTLQNELPEQWPLQAPPTHTAMLIHNLLENAVKYATEGGKIKIACLDSSEGKTLTLFNTYSPYLSLDSAPLFEPFFRPDASRQSETGGNGLGLAICKALCDVNGWHLSLEQTQEGVWVRVGFVASSHGDESPF